MLLCGVAVAVVGYRMDGNSFDDVVDDASTVADVATGVTPLTASGTATVADTTGSGSWTGSWIGAGLEQPAQSGLEMLADAAQSSLYMLLSIAGGCIALIAFVGVTGHWVYYKQRMLGKLILRAYCIVVFLLLLANGLLFAAIFWYVSVLDSRLDQDWERFQNSEHSQAIRQYNVTKEEFVDVVVGNFKFMMVAAAAIIGVLALSCWSTNFVVTTGRELPKPGTDEDELTKEMVEGDGQGNGGKGREAKKHQKLSKKQRKEQEKAEAAKAIADAAIAKDEANNGTMEVESGPKRGKTKGRKRKNKKGKHKTMESTMLSSTGAKDIDALWKKADADGSGSLDKKELRKLMKKMGKNLSDAEFKVRGRHIVLFRCLLFVASTA
eukprot:COSAG01_NODE_7639_length_3118_cov_1.827426_4_plen_381_part_00